MNYEIIIGFVISFIAICTPLIKLNTNITKLSESINELTRRLDLSEKTLNRVTATIQEHEVRLVKLEDHERGNQ